MIPDYHTNSKAPETPSIPSPLKLIANARTMNNELKILLDGLTDTNQAK